MIENGLKLTNDNNIKKEVVLLELESFKELYYNLIEGNYHIKKLEKDIQNFCLESEKNNYICEKNEEYKILKKNVLFDKFNMNKNVFDFQLSMSDLTIKFFRFLNETKINNKREYSILHGIIDIFKEIKKNNLIMKDIQCLLDNGILCDYNNNFFVFLLTINDKYYKQILFFFDLKKYFLSKIENINIFISKVNELINYYEDDKKQFLFVRKIGTILTEIFSLFEKSDNNKDEELNIFIICKDKIVNLINKDKIFEIFFSYNDFISHMDILLNIFEIFPTEIDNQINILLNKKEKIITKALMKFILKNAKVLSNYIKDNTITILNNISIDNSYKFHMKQYNTGKDRLINIYIRYKDNEAIMKQLVNYLKKNNKSEQAKLIEDNKYNEEYEYELEEKEIEKNNKNKYFKLPEEYIFYYISAEDDNNYNKSLNLLNDIITNKIKLDKYMGVDTEWKSSNNFYDLYQENLGINQSNLSDLADIIQVAGINHGFIFDLKSIIKSEELKEKIKIMFQETIFIGFEFTNDAIKLGQFFKEIIFQNEFIELSAIYKEKKNKKTPELRMITSELFGKELDKRDQISDWSKRPLLKNQMIYGILDAYILLLIYKKLKEK